MKMLVAGMLAALGAAAMQGRAVEAAASCESLATLALPNATITSAQPVDAGAFRPPNQTGTPRGFAALPAFCRVAATLAPSSDSDIKIEVWLPASNWNGKFQAVGNGAFNGTIAYPALATALARGYAAASTDTGHVGGSASFALGHPEKVIDFGYRAVHEMTVSAKAIVAAHYGAGPRFSYWSGCSAGGRQGLKAAQRFPADFDGIIAGAPGLDWTGRASQAARVAQALQRDEAARLPEAQLALAQHRGVAGVRCQRRRQGRHRQRSAALQVRPGGAPVQWGGRRGVPHARPGPGREADLFARREPEHEARDLRALPGQRAGLDRAWLVRLRAHDRTRPVPVPRLQGSRVGDPAVRRGRRRGARGRGGRRDAQRARSRT